MAALDLPPLRMVVCGSVDDGKSTLLGRLLFELGQLPDDRLQEVESASRRFGTCGEEIDYALALDGLEDERAQGITIDVAYRSVQLNGRRVILADSPGHSQYTRNMAVAASKADAALVMVDARRGIVEQTLRHTRILSLFGVPRVTFVVNKVDLVDDAKARFAELADGLATLAADARFADVATVPCSARLGWNLTVRSAELDWYTGETVLAALTTAPSTVANVGDGARLPVQLVLRPDQDFRGFAGTLHGGGLAVGDALLASPSGHVASVAGLHVAGEPAEQALAGAAVVVRLDREIDVARGDVLAARAAPVQAADQFAVHLLALADTPLLPGRPYDLQLGTRRVRGQITELKHRLDVESGQHIAATKLEANEIGYGNLHTLEPIPYSPYDQDRKLGGFLMVDRDSLATVACGTIAFALRRADNIHWQTLEVSAATRAASLGQTPRCLWMTGLSGSGKSTIASRAERLLQASGHHGYVLDGDNLRHGLNKDLGFTAADRVENIRRVAQVAKLMVDAGLIVLVSFISPYRAERRMARELFAEGEFVEVFVDTPLAVCEARDVKGLYAKARRGALPNFTGIDAPYEAPESAELTVDTTYEDADRAARRILAAAGIPLD